MRNIIRARRWVFVLWVALLAGGLSLAAQPAHLDSRGTGSVALGTTSGAAVSFQLTNIGYDLSSGGDRLSGMDFTLTSTSPNVAIWFGYHNDPGQTGAIYSTAANMPSHAVQACTLVGTLGHCRIDESLVAITQLYAEVWRDGSSPSPPGQCTVNCTVISLTPTPPAAGPMGMSGEVWGRIVYEDGSVPQNATVSLDGQRPQHPAATGFYRFAGVPLGGRTIALAPHDGTVVRVVVDGVAETDPTPTVDLTASQPNHRVDFVLAATNLTVSPPPSASGPLASTGGNVWPEMLLGGLLLCVGVAMAWQRRRRTKP